MARNGVNPMRGVANQCEAIVRDLCCVMETQWIRGSRTKLSDLAEHPGHGLFDLGDKSAVTQFEHPGCIGLVNGPNQSAAMLTFIVV